MRRPKHRLRAPVVALLLALAAALPPAPIAAVDPPPQEGRHGGTIFEPGRAGPAVAPGAGPAIAPTPVPSGFRDELVVGGLTEPTAVQFASDGRIIVAEKSGRIKVFSAATDTNPGVYSGLQANVYDYWDRGMLGMVIDPQFTTGRPYIYVSYTYNHILGQGTGPGQLPRWANDECPDPPNSTIDGCVASGRIDRLTVDGKNIVADANSPKKLVEDWCQQFPSHSMGSLAFYGGALLATGGEGASFDSTDWGQLGGSLAGTPTPINPCGDPPGNAPGHGNTDAVTAQGGSLRSQDLRTRANPVSDPVGLNGTLIRINPDTGAAWPANNLAGDPDANAKRIIAYGLRNPFRFAIRPGTDDVWIGDVGNYSYEEVNEITNPNGAPKNFGWPCFEGGNAAGASFRNGDWDNLENTLCEDLYDDDGETAPVFAYSHNQTVVAENPPGTAGDLCGTGSSAIAGLAFLGTTSSYPDAFDRALFISDYNRKCIWSVRADVSGRPDFSTRALFVDLRPLGAQFGAVNLTTAPNGDLVYVTFDTSEDRVPGEVRRIHWYSTVPPTASFTATPESGPTPLTVTFDASSSANPNAPDPLQYEWDLDNDGSFDDGTTKVVTRQYGVKEETKVWLRVTSSSPLTDTTMQTIWPGYAVPTATITSPSTSFRWAVGDSVPFAGTAKDGDGATLPPSAMSWSVTMEHCPSNCHSHPPFFTFTGASGSFAAPDHGYPSHLQLRLTVTDGPLSKTVTQDIFPKTGITRVRSDPAGLPLSIAGTTGSPPPNTTAIVGSTVTVTAPSSGTLGVTQYTFDRWSDGGAAAHGVVTTTATQTLTAHYRATGPLTIFRPLDPVRLLDTRIGNGLTGTLKANTARTFQVTGRGGVPADAVAVTGNVTVTHQTGPGHVALTPLPTNTPPGSNLNFPVGVDRGSVVTATLGPGGKLSAVYVAAAGKTTQLVFDVTGYFTANGTNGTYKPLDPVRLLDTRIGNGLSGKFVAGTRRAWQITGRAGIPAAATAVTANLAVVGPTAAGHVTLYPAGAPTSSTSTLNFTAGEIAANGVVIRLGSDGRLSAAMSGPAGASTHLILDVTGYFLNDASGARYVPLFPGRALDTRIGLGISGRFTANTGHNLSVAGILGVPTGAVAVNGTLTVTAASAAGQLSLLRTAANTSSTSTLNFLAAETRGNGFFCRMSTGGSVGILYTGPSGANTHVVLDLAGYFK